MYCCIPLNPSVVYVNKHKALAKLITANISVDRMALGLELGWWVCGA
jgi:hypothetical protein